MWKNRANTTKLKRKKVKNWCPKCIFSCESKLITMDNVNNKCCLTYEQALKNGFYKDLRWDLTTSLYRTSIDAKGKNVQYHIARQETKYNDYGKTQ